MNNFAWAIVSVILLCGSATAGVLITVENRSLDGTGPELVVSKIAIDGKRVRIDHHESNKSGRGSVIYRGDKKQMIVLDHRGNSFQIMTRDSMQAMNQQMETMLKQMASKLAELPPAQRKMMEQMMQHQMPQATAPRAAKQTPLAADVRKTEAKRRIKGYPTTRYDVYDRGNRVREMWIAAWVDTDVKRNDLRVFKEMHQFQQEAFASMNRGAGFQDNDAAFDEFRQVDGLPVVITSFKGTVKNRETTLKAVEQRGFDDSYFAPPKDYTEERRFAGPKASGSAAQP